MQYWWWLLMLIYHKSRVLVMSDEPEPPWISAAWDDCAHISHFWYIEITGDMTKQPYLSYLLRECLNKYQILHDISHAWHLARHFHRPAHMLLSTLTLRQMKSSSFIIYGMRCTIAADREPGGQIRAAYAKKCIVSSHMLSPALQPFITMTWRAALFTNEGFLMFEHPAYYYY